MIDTRTYIDASNVRDDDKPTFWFSGIHPLAGRVRWPHQMSKDSTHPLNTRICVALRLRPFIRSATCIRALPKGGVEGVNACPEGWGTFFMFKRAFLYLFFILSLLLLLFIYLFFFGGGEKSCQDGLGVYFVIIHKIQKGIRYF